MKKLFRNRKQLSKKLFCHISKDSFSQKNCDDNFANSEITPVKKSSSSFVDSFFDSIMPINNITSKKVFIKIFTGVMLFILSFFFGLTRLYVYILSSKDNPKANEMLGDMYKDGNPLLFIKANMDTALMYYGRSAKLGSDMGKYKKGKLLKEKKGNIQEAQSVFEQITPESPILKFAKEELGDILKDYHKNYEKAFQEFKDAAEKGNPVAMYKLGRMFEEGQGTDINIDKAVEQYSKAADLGYADAQNSLALAYAEGKGKNKDLKKAKEWFEKAAVQGNGFAQNNLGLMYCEGLGVGKRNYNKAYYWINKSASHNSKGEISLGYLLQNGYGVKRNYSLAEKQYIANKDDSVAQCLLGYLNEEVYKKYDTAKEWYEKSESKGNSSAQYNLGLLYAKGKGVQKNLKKSLDLFQKAAAQGNIFAEDAINKIKSSTDESSNELAKFSKANDSQSYNSDSKCNICYPFQKDDKDIYDSEHYDCKIKHYNNEINKMREKSDKWIIDLADAYIKVGKLKQAIDLLEQVNIESKQINLAQKTLGDIYHRKDPYKAFKAYKLSAEKGNKESMFMLGIMYAKGDGTEKDMEKSADMFEHAAGLGHISAQNYLGIAYLEGKGKKQDYNQAIKLFMKSAKSGHRQAQYNLGNIYYNGFGVKQDYKEALKWYRQSAAQGNSDAMYNIGYMYENAQGVKQDYLEAVKWYMKASLEGNSSAQYYLGNMYKNGLGVKPDYSKAVKWYRKSAENGNYKAMANIALLYEEGYGVTKSIAESKKWWSKTSKAVLKYAEDGDAFAQRTLGEIYFKGLGLRKH